MLLGFIFQTISLFHHVLKVKKKEDLAVLVDCFVSR